MATSIAVPEPRRNGPTVRASAAVKSCRDIGVGKPERESERRQRTQLVALRLTPVERDLLVMAARDRGIPLSQLIREAALRDAIARPDRRTATRHALRK
ncbi:plasmid mobilization protein [Mycolicibacterium elephantis]|uniref:plasmid mobilization protein n=1 Tax=Mycobacteriaceae TaxID=1762 RepID=UPI0039B731BB